MAHIKLLDPFKKELPLGVPTDLQSGVKKGSTY